MKDLKENIQRNNIKKIVLSVVLGMFCYYTNNAMDPEPENPQPKENKKIEDVLTMMLRHQVIINGTSSAIENYKKKIYYRISEGTKVTKKKVLGFIKNHFTEEEQKKDGFQDDINKIEQYFHLEKIKEEEEECTKDNLTEIFWEKVETMSDEDKKEIGTEGELKIKKYFQTIIEAEKAISEDFKKYYDEKKNKEEEKTDEDILKEIMNDCCGEEISGDIQTKILNNLEKLCTKKSIVNKDSKITGKIKRRITLSNGTGEYENDFIYFLKQKIGEEKKEPVPPVKIPSVHTKKEECPCCC